MNDVGAKNLSKAIIKNVDKAYNIRINGDSEQINNEWDFSKVLPLIYSKTKILRKMAKNRGGNARKYAFWLYLIC